MTPQSNESKARKITKEEPQQEIRDLRAFVEWQDGDGEQCATMSGVWFAALAYARSTPPREPSEGTDTSRLDLLQELIRNCPHAEFSYNDDLDEGELGYGLCVDGCDPIELIAPNMRELLDRLAAEIRAQNGGKQP